MAARSEAGSKRKEVAPPSRKEDMESKPGISISGGRLNYVNLFQIPSLLLCPDFYFF